MIRYTKVESCQDGRATATPANSSRPTRSGIIRSGVPNSRELESAYMCIRAVDGLQRAA
jgi:hypothetical protein